MTLHKMYRENFEWVQSYFETLSAFSKPPLADIADIAMQMTKLECYSKANALSDGHPSAMEMIAIQMGAANDGDSIKGAIDRIGTYIEELTKEQ